MQRSRKSGFRKVSRRVPDAKALLQTVEAKLLFDDETGDAARRVIVSTKLYDDGLAWVTVRGRGSLEGMRAAGDVFERSFTHLSAEQRVRVGVDLEGFEGAPLAAQLSLVEWMIRFQGRLQYVGVAGGDTAALKIARAIQGLLPFGGRVGFFEEHSALLRHLNGHVS